MSTVRIKAGATEPIEILAVDAFGAALPGLGNLKVKIRRVANAQFIDWSDNTFKAGASCSQLLQPLQEISPTYGSGEYRLNSTPHVKGFNTAAITNPYTNDVYRVTVVQDGAPQNAANLPQIGEIKVGEWVEYFDDFISNHVSQDDMRGIIREFGLDHLVSVNPGVVPPAANTYIRQILDKMDSLTIVAESAFEVKQNWAYNPSANVLVGQTWLEHANIVVTMPSSVVVTWYTDAGVALFTLTSATPDAQGIIRLEKDAPGLVRNVSYYAIASFVVSGEGPIIGCKGMFTIG
jgi:hypothetical protein